MKRIMAALAFIVFGMVVSQFSLADAENPADLIQQIIESNRSRKIEFDSRNTIELEADTAFKPASESATTQTSDKSKITE